MSEDKSIKEPEIISAHKFQALIGALGIILPLLCLYYGLFNRDIGVLTSISAFYYTQIHGPFVAILCTLGLCLICYEGYDPIDRIAGNIGGTAALLVGLCPTRPSSTTDSEIFEGVQRIIWPGHDICAQIHDGAAITLFVVLSVFAGYLFPRTGPQPNSPKTITESFRNLKFIVVNGEPNTTPEKGFQNKIYRSCAVIMTFAMVLVGLHNFIHFPKPNETLIWSEILAISAFGVSWMTKSGKLEKYVSHLIFAQSILILVGVFWWWRIHLSLS
jgi:hypothetical protein